jgi:hypothetical protein
MCCSNTSSQRPVDASAAAAMQLLVILAINASPPEKAAVVDSRAYQGCLWAVLGHCNAVPNSGPSTLLILMTTKLQLQSTPRLVLLPK